jgi:hypothetical protein
MNRREVLRASALGGAAAVSARRVDAAGFGVTGDGRTDDTPAIQAALDRTGELGGGTVYLASPKSAYRVTRGLKLPSDVVLEGAVPVRYPYSASNPGACRLVADFAEPMQWVIEPRTSVLGRALRYDELVTDTLADGVTYNCGVRNLLITSTGSVPFGGIRMHCCPGSFVEAVSIDRVGCGLLVNYSFGGSYQVQSHALYFGAVAWDDANANLFDVYASRKRPWSDEVPVAYRLPFLAQMQGHIGDTLKLGSERYGSQSVGLVCGSSRSASINNVFDLVAENFSTGVFLFNAYATDFRRFYVEGEPGVSDCALAATRSRFSAQSLHAYLSGKGALFDLGLALTARLFMSGIPHVANFGKAPVDDRSSLLILEGLDPSFPGAPTQPGIRYAAGEQSWIPVQLENGWRPVGSDAAMPAARFDPWSHRVELRGAISGGRPGKCLQLPAICRPAHKRLFAVAGGHIEVTPDGTVSVMPLATVVALDGVDYSRW